MDNQDKEKNDFLQDNPAIEKVTLAEIKQNKSDELVDKIMEKILKIK